METLSVLSEGDVRHAARLARLGLNGDEAARLRAQLADILGHFRTLAQVDTDGVEVTGHATDVRSVMRDDEAAESLPRSDVLLNAPDPAGEFFRVRRIL